MKIKQNIMSGRLHQNEVIVERAKNLSLANNFVTDLTSFVNVIDDGARNSTPIIDTYNMSSLISAEENSGDSGPCKITLCSDEFYEGESVTFSSSVTDLSVWDFQEKLISVRVEGTCHWEIFRGD